MQISTTQIRLSLVVAFFMALFGVFLGGISNAADSLEEALLEEGAVELAEQARELGEAKRGALIFFQAHMACAKCHATDESTSLLGPNLSQPEKPLTDAFIVESILTPSKSIRKGFTSVTVVAEGRPVTGLLVKQTETEITLREVDEEGALLVFEIDDEDEDFEIVHGDVSLMPKGQVNQLANRQQFLDLIRYVMEVSEHGPQRATELRPDESLLKPTPLPEYEQHIDHRGMIASFDEKAFQRGEAIYSRTCANCHGTHETAGSMPTSPRFTFAKQLKNGSDPLSMYKTLTHGYKMMVAQRWMVPQQKYDVIHYLREEYFREDNKELFVEIDDAYLASLPKGNTRGPEPVKNEPWLAMDYGQNLIGTYEFGTNSSNFAYKGIAVRLDRGVGGVARGTHWSIFDHDTMRVAGAWRATGGEDDPNFINWQGIAFDGRHNSHPRVVGQVDFQNPTGPGWANPATGSFEDPRELGRDGRPYGPLPRAWSQYKGLYRHGDQVIVSYTVGKTPVLELPGLKLRAGSKEGSGPQPIYTRTLNLGARARALEMQVVKVSLQGKQGEATGKMTAQGNLRVRRSNSEHLVVGVLPKIKNMKLHVTDAGEIRLGIPAGENPLRFVVWTAVVDPSVKNVEGLFSAPQAEALDLAAKTKKNTPRWPQLLSTRPQIGTDKGPFTVDILTTPDKNPWLAQMRLTGLDFFRDANVAAISTWDGDVWLVRGMDVPIKGPEAESRAGSQQQGTGELTWQRIATGLFQPLGIKIVDEQIFVSCRDQIVRLHDTNGDGETDFYECFNNDHQVTEHFHEFAMGLQTDTAGNFYYAKSARHALVAVVPHHGTLLRVSKDGQETKIVANGFRAANGVCINPDGTFIVTDQEGHWNPKNRINWVREGGFYGNMYGYHDVTDTADDAMDAPICWITNSFDRSPAELLWTETKAWGPLEGMLLNLSYGYGKIYVVPHEELNGQMQGGMCELPIPKFPTGTMRARFHPTNGQLYTCGMYAWAGTQQKPGGLYRVRYTGQPVHLPVGLHAKKRGMEITFSGELDVASAELVKNYHVEIWEIKRTKSYGSRHYNEHDLSITCATLSPDRKTVFLEIPGIGPTWCMEIRYTLQGSAGEKVHGKIHNTIYALGE